MAALLRGGRGARASRRATSAGCWPRSASRAAADPSAAAEVLVEPLSEREREVLRLLATDLSGPEIARELVVSLNTVRTHTKNIYAKLGVNSRRAAVRRADGARPVGSRGRTPLRDSPRRSPHVVIRAHHIRP